MQQVVFELNKDNALHRAYLFYICILMLKLVLMSILTGMKRMKTKAFTNPEDTKFFNQVKPCTDDEVERVRRAHLNDLENIPAFIVVSYVYILTSPSLFLATNLFRLYAAARFAHTLVYAVYVVPQPARGIAFFVGFGITVYMAIHGILYFL